MKKKQIKLSWTEKFIAKYLSADRDRANRIIEAARIAAEAEAVLKKPDEEEVITHGESSRLGRRVARQSQTLASIKETLDLLKERILTRPVKEEIEEEFELPENPTADEIKEYVKKERERTIRVLKQETAQASQAEQEKSNKYASEYERLIAETLDPDDDADVYKMMTDMKDLTYNRVWKGDPKEDFLINYKAATKSILSKAKPVKTTVLGKTAGSVNVPTATKVVSKVVDRSKLSSEEQQIARLFDDEELATMGI